MKGLFYRTLYYFKIACAFCGPVFLFVAGMAFGDLLPVIGVGPTRKDAFTLLLVGLFAWGVAAARIFKKH